MNTPGIIHITAKIISNTESVCIQSGYNKIKAAFHNLPVKRRTKTSKITITEYCEFYGFDLNEYVNQINIACKMNIINEK